MSRSDRSRFRSLCENLLNTTTAYLIPTGPTAALIAAQRYPAECAEPALGSLAQQALTKPELILPIDPQQYGGAIWAVALWREQGMAGLLLLGPRRDNSLYTQEEIEIARLPANGSSTWRPASRFPNA